MKGGAGLQAPGAQGPQKGYGIRGWSVSGWRGLGTRVFLGLRAEAEAAVPPRLGTTCR